MLIILNLCCCLFVSITTLQPDPYMADYDKAATAEMNSYLGTELLLQGDPTGALEKLSQALELNPDLWEARYNRGLANLQLGSHQAAFNDLAQCSKACPDEPHTLRLLALLAWSENRLGTATSLLEKAVISPQATPEVWRDLGQVYLAAGKWEDGKQALKQYLELQPNASDASLVLDLIQMAGDSRNQDAIVERLQPPLPENETPLR